MSKQMIAAVYPLTPTQEGILYHYLSDDAKGSYLEQASFRIKGQLSIGNLEKALNHAVQNNEGLRTVIKWAGLDKPVQIILTQRQVKIRQVDLTQSIGEKALDEAVQRAKEEDRVQGFDLLRGPLFKLTICLLGEEQYELIWNYHHICMDGWSSQMVWQETIQAYTAICAGKEPIFKAKTSLKEYLKFLQNYDHAGAKAYWRNYLSGFAETTALPKDGERGTEFQTLADVQYSLTPKLSEQLQELARQQKVTINLILQMAWGVLLQRYNNTEDVVFGTTVAGRPYQIPQVHEMIGLFINTLPVRVQSDSSTRVTELLARLKTDSFQRTRHELSSLVELKAGSEIGSREQLFEHILVFENFPIQQMVGEANLDWELIGGSQQLHTNFDLTLIALMADRLHYQMVYRREVFKLETLNRMAGHLENLLTQIAENPEGLVADLQIMGSREQEQVLREFNQTGVTYPLKRAVQELFAEQVLRTPDELAIYCAGVGLTYQQLNERAEEIGRYLRSLGVSRNTLVGIMMDRSIEMLVGLLGILKAGGAYLPIDPLYPAERIGYMLEDAQISLLLSQRHLLAQIPEGYAENVLVLEAEGLTLATKASGGEWQLAQVASVGAIDDGGVLEIINEPDDLAYVIYTSGSTGKPKGVMLEHRNLLNLLHFSVHETNVDYKGRMLQFTSLSFDVSFQEIFTPLTVGGSVYLISDDTRKDVLKMLDYLNTHAIEIISFPFSYLNFLFEDEENVRRLPQSIKHIITAGEQLIITESLRQYLETHQVYLHNHYGPSETHVVTILTLGGDSELPQVPGIGRPISNTQVYILNNRLEPVPVGVSGEIYIAGANVGRGYLYRPELTAERYIPNPYRSGRLYKTGDLGKWTEAGEIEFLGRADQQVKIRGHRVEIGEVEATLLTHPQIKQAAVVDRVGTDGRKYLAAYIVESALGSNVQLVGADELVSVQGEEVSAKGQIGVANDSKLTPAQLREYLQSRLPEYMVPSAFIFLPVLPLTPSGKVNRKALPEPEGSVVGAEYVAPRNQIQEVLARIWGEVLGVERVGIYDNFFELGGHSLKATQVVARAMKELQLEIPVKLLFTTQTIARLSELLDSTQSTQYQEILPQPKQTAYPLSHAQRRLWVIYQLEDSNVAYNMPSAFLLEGDLNLSAFRQAFASIIERHEILRTRFDLIDGEPMQIVEDSCRVELAFLDWQGKNQDAELYQLVNADAAEPFDLTQAGLIRATIVRLSEKTHLFFFTMHHIISDGWSNEILIREMTTLYDAFTQGQQNPLSQLKIQYRDYALWQETHLKSERMRKEEKYWLDELQGELPVLNMPTDYPRPPVQSFAGANYAFNLGPELTGQLKRFAQEQGATLYMVLFAAYNALLYRYTGQEDIIIGTPVAGRKHRDLEGLIGFFVNTLALRTRFSGQDSLKQLLSKAKQVALNGFEHQDYPFDLLIDKLALERDLSRSPLFDTMFNLLNVGDGRGDRGFRGLKVSHFPQEVKTSRFDLLLTMHEIGGTLYGNFEYSTTLFKGESIERLVQHFAQLLAEGIARPDSTVSELTMLTNTERQRVLISFNATEEWFGDAGDQLPTVQQLFETQVRLTPEKTAIYFENQTLTYRQLNEKANRLARLLRAKGVSPNTLVGVMLDRSLEMVCGLLAILKAGGAYVPLDPTYPKERIQYMLNDAAAPVLLTEQQYVEKIAESYHGEILDIHLWLKFLEGKVSLLAMRETAATLWEDSGSPALEINPAENLENWSSPEDLVYVIYTSGSTGKPKGVQLRQKNLVNLLYFELKHTNIDFASKMLQFTSLSFDVSFQEIFTPLAAGGTVYLITDEKRKDLDEMLNFLAEHQIEIISFPFSYLNFLFEKRAYIRRLPESLRHIITAGEQLIITDNLREYLENHPVYLHNHYGPSETHVVTTLTLSRESGLPRIPGIGHPISNTSIYILDHLQQPQPIGVPGEIYIAGANVGAGYLHRPELTAERFLANPFGPGQMYRTGDLGRWLADGSIEFLGRVDYQVKIRGFRVEIGEVEGKLLTHSKIKQAVVVDRKDAEGRKYLLGYLVAEGELEANEVRTHLLRSLPDYMVPAAFVFLNNLPLTPSGKVDRKALPEPVDVAHQSVRDYLPPRNSMEEVVARIWAEVLGVERIGILDNFFELGGHSLKATQIVSRIYRELDVKIPLKLFFTTPTIAGIMGEIQSTRSSVYEEIKHGSNRSSNYAPLSHAQRRLWVIYQLEEENNAYNMPMAFKLEGYLDVTAFKAAFQTVIDRHEILRTRFEVLDGQPMQVVEEGITHEMEYLEWPVAQESELLQFINAEAAKPFDLTESRLIRSTLIRLADNSHIFLVTMHHIITDGWSNDILVEEIGTLYNAYFHKMSNPLPPLKLQYRDYAEWQAKALSQGEMDAQKKYWLSEFTGDLPVLNLPTDYPRPRVQSFAGDSYTFVIGKDLTARLQAFATEAEVSLFMLLFAGYCGLLHRLTGQEDFIVGTPIAGRAHPDLEKMIGFFVNTLALRIHVRGNESFLELLGRVKESTLDAYEHQDYPFDLLVDQLPLERDMSRSPLFDTLFNLLNMSGGVKQKLDLPSLTIEPCKQEIKTSRMDLLWTIREHQGQLYGYIEYCTDLFKPGTIQRMTEYYTLLLSNVVTNPETSIIDVEIVPAEEKYLLLHTFNTTDAEFPVTQSVQQLFEKQVARNPEALAVFFEGDEWTDGVSASLSYGELNRRANRLARYLRRAAVGRDTLVGVMVERSLEMIIGLLAILKAGGAYLPLDPSYPAERLEYMLHNAEAPLLLTQSWLKSRIPQGFAGSSIALDQWFAEKAHNGSKAEDDHNLEAINQPEDLIYVIYTSGSTGKPKGVSLQHGNMINLLYFEMLKTNVDYSGRMLQFTSLSFDVSFQEIFTPLAAGGSVYLITDESRKNLDQMFKFLNDHQIEIISFPFSYLNFMFEERENLELLPPSLKHIITAGEQLIITEHLREYLMRHDVHLHNHYGPSETHAGTALTMSKETELPRVPGIGRPISNAQVYILNQKLAPQPLGVAGEIYIAGAGVGRGYLNRPDLTDERFLSNQFGAGRMYKTGDLGRWLPDGTIEFLGRLDYQVKIRGFRVEIGEVEAALLAHDKVRKAVVVDRVDAQQRKYLAAYLMADTGADVTEIRAYLLGRLPDYMVPSAFIYLDEFPMTPSGKVDRKALPEPDGMDTGAEYVAPRNQLERRLAEIWAEVLGVERVGIHDNFFELGGHSLKATQIVSRIHKEMNCKISLRIFFTAPTIAQMVEAANLSGKAQYREITPIAKASHYPLSHAQRRLWIIHQLEEGNIAYNMPSVFRLQGELNVAAFRQAFQTVVDRHEILRTRFAVIDGEPVQVVEDELSFEIPYVQWESTDAELQQFVQREVVRAFDFTQAGLLRATLIRLQDGDHLFLFVMHHIITDGWSNDLLVRELVALYSAYSEGFTNPLPPLKIQYRDYSAWQAQLFAGEEMQTDEEYWLDHLAPELPVLQLPLDYKRPPMQTFRGDSYSFVLSDELAELIRKFAQEQGITTFQTLFAAYNLLLYRYTGQKDLIVGTPIAGRQDSDLEDLIGFFVNSLALRTQLTGEESFSEFVENVQQTVLAGFEHSDYPFDLLVERLQVERDMSRAPVFDTMFTLQKVQGDSIQTSSLRLEPVENEFKTSRFDLIMNMAEKGDKFCGGLNYNTDLFKRETMARMAEHWQILLSNVLNHPEIPVGRVEMLSDAERQRILVEFNDTRRPYPKEQSLQQLFEAQVASNPNATALILGDEQMTYAELNQAANSLAYQLRDARVTVETPVGVLVERSFAMIIAIVGIVKAGGVYVPIDPTQPVERIEYILNDADVRLCVATAETRGLLPKDYTGHVLELGSDNGNNEVNPTSVAKAENLAYIMYTSGSTGKPKGTLIQQYSITRLVKCTNYLDITPTDRILQISNYTFDGSTFDIWGALLNGAGLVLVTQEEIISLDALAELIAQSGATMTFIPTAMFNNIADINPKIFRGFKRILVGGERMSAEHVAKVYAETGPAVLVNAYGPTEATTFATYYELSANPLSMRNIPIGRPILNTTVYILNAYAQPVPVGVIGEIHIGGDGVAKGYLNRPELTAEKFIANPFEEGQLMYKTGDLGRFLPDGSIEYYGRSDKQVKIRGFRVEPEEIEAALLKCTAVKDAVVIDRLAEQGVRYLAAYVVKHEGKKVVDSSTQMDASTKHVAGSAPADEYDGKIVSGIAVDAYGEQPVGGVGVDANSRLLADNESRQDMHLLGENSADSLRHHLLKTLPEYMIPAAFVFLSALPLTPNGKVDRRALPEPSAEVHEDGEYTAPRNDWEAKLAKIWSEVLGVPRVGIHDNFFELGGYSLKATQVLSRARQELEVEIPLKLFFKSPTIAGIAAEVGMLEEITYAGIKAHEPRHHYPLSPAQKRIWLIEQMNEGNTAYNIPVALIIKGNLKSEALQQTLQTITDRHEILRTRFQEMDGEPVQIVVDECQLDFKYVRRSELAGMLLEMQGSTEVDIETLRKIVASEAMKSFDLEKPGQMRTQVVELAEGEHLLIITLHHIISDGWSLLNIMLKELTLLYKAYMTGAPNPLPKLPIQYRDYAIYLAEQVRNGQWAEQEKYWLNQLSGEIPVLDLAKDYPPVGLTDGNGAIEHLRLDADLTHRLKALCDAEGVTLFMLTVAVVNLLLHKLSKETDIAVGTPVTGRNYREVEGLLGIFLNTLVLRTDLSGDPTFVELLKRVKEVTLQAFEHQDYPYELILDKLNTSRTNLFNVLINYIPDFLGEEMDFGGLKMEEVNIASETAKFEWGMYLQELAQELNIKLTYRKDLFSKEMIERALGYLQDLFVKILEEPMIRLSEVQLVTENEQVQLLGNFNDDLWDE